MNLLLWVIQILLALLFVYAGAMKFIMPTDQILKLMPSMSAGFLHFIGVAEILGGIGLVLPWALKKRPGLTPLAAILLAVIMAGATWVTFRAGQGAMALFPAVTGLLCLMVARRRRRELRG